MERISETPPSAGQAAQESPQDKKALNGEDVRRFRELRRKQKQSETQNTRPQKTRRRKEPETSNRQEPVSRQQDKQPREENNEAAQQLLGDRILQGFQTSESTPTTEAKQPSALSGSEAVEQISRLCRQFLVARSSGDAAPMRFVLKESLLPNTSLLAEPLAEGGVRLRFLSSSPESLALLRRHRKGIAARAQAGASKGMSVEVEVVEEEAER